MPIPVKTVNELGRTEADGRVYLDHAKRYLIGAALFDAGDDYRIPVEANRTVLEVRAHIETAFDVATTLVIGDGADADGYFKTGQLDPAVLGARYCSFKGGDEDGVSGITTPNGYAYGRTYTATGFILIALNGNPTVGRLEVEVVYAGYAEASRDMISN